MENTAADQLNAHIQNKSFANADKNNSSNVFMMYNNDTKQWEIPNIGKIDGPHPSNEVHPWWIE